MEFKPGVGRSSAAPGWPRHGRRGWLIAALLGCLLGLVPFPARAQAAPLPSVRCDIDTLMLPAGSERAWPGNYLIVGTLHRRDTGPPPALLVQVALYDHRDYADSSCLLLLGRYLRGPASASFLASFRPRITGTREVFLRVENTEGEAYETQTLRLPVPAAVTTSPSPAPVAATRGTRFALILLSIVIAGLPFVLFGAAVSGLIEVHVSPDQLAAWFGRRPARAVLVALTIGLVLPVCECGIVPVARRLMRKGLSPYAGLVFLLTDPIINLVTIASTGVAFGFSSLILWGRCLGGIAVALATAAVVVAVFRGRLLRPAPSREGPVSRLEQEVPVPRPPSPGPPAGGGHAAAHDPACLCGHDHDAGRTPGRRFIRAMTGEFLEFLFYLTLGAAITAALQTLAPVGALAGASGGPFASVVAMMLLAVILSICSSADAFVALGYPAFPPGAILAFLLFGPVFDLKLFIMYNATFRRRVVWVLAGTAALFVLLIGVAVNVAVGGG